MPDRPELSTQRAARNSQPWLRRLHVVTLASFAVAQPLYDMIAREPDFLVAHDVTPPDLVFFSLVVSLAVPALLVAMGWLVHFFSAKAGELVDLFSISIFVALVVIQVFRKLGSTGWFTLALAVATGIAATVAYCRFSVVKRWVTALGPAIVLFPVVFLFFSPVQRLLSPAPVESSPVSHGDGPPVVLVILDELPVTSLMNAEHTIDALRYPGFAALAETSHWFRNATTVAPYTKESLPAILTGRLPDRRRMNTLGDFPKNLFTILGTSYDLKVVETSYRLCPQELNLARAPRAPFRQRFRALLSDSAVAVLHAVTPSKLATGLPPVSLALRDFVGSPATMANDPYSRARDSAWIFQYFLDQIEPTSQPTLYFLHSTVPHPPWMYLPSGKQYGPVGLPRNPHGLSDQQLWGTNEWSVLQVWQRHLLQVQYADRFLTRLLARLREAGIFDRALIIVTSDHGSAFRAGGARRPITAGSAADVLSIPLFIKEPGQEAGTIDDRVVQTIDIAPTIADCLEIEMTHPVDGQSVLDPDHHPEKVELMLDEQGSATGPFDADPDAKYESLHRMISHFGTGASPDGLFTFGPYGALVGQRAVDIGIGPATVLRAVLEQDWVFDDVDLESSFVPSHILGKLTGVADGAAELYLAVQVNGVVQATTRTFDHRGGEARFTAMVAERAFVEGPNHVEIFAVNDSANGLTLEPAEIGPSLTCRLSRKRSQEIIECSDGWRGTVDPLAVRGRVHFRGRIVHGWAADIPAGTPATRILVFRGRELLLEVPTGEFQQAFARRDERLAYCGFEFHLQESTLNADEMGALRFFAVCNEKLSNLQIFH